MYEKLKSFWKKPLWKNSGMTYGYVIFSFILWETLMMLKYRELRFEIIIPGILGAIVLVYLIEFVRNYLKTGSK